MSITSSRSVESGRLLAIAAALALCGCGVSTPALDHAIDLVGPVPANAVCGARTQARSLGWPLRVRAATAASAGARILAMDAAIDAKPAAVLVAAGDPGALAAPLQSARSTGIVVVRVPRDPSAGEAAAAVRRAIAATGRRSTPRVTLRGC